MTLYFISGLGADKRIFEKITISNTYKIVYLDWIIPLKNETLQEYALRFSSKINTTEPFCIIGLSFGGILSIELSKILSAEKIILISSISSQTERPWYFKILNIVPIHKFIPKRFLQIKIPFVYKHMGVTNSEEQSLFYSMLVDTNITFFRWAVTSIINWKQTETIKNLYHIHGSTDQMFPIRYTNPTYIVPNGKHIMVYTQSKKISEILSEIIRH
ncbi:hypothetical protein [Cytophaga aurantiaca]|uniref:hypothetical protein n=1 Tax=Cytophaga aurantiaca TaxID=29530 RepID=UPI00036B25D5|nr:hypothetical protein [Cytophaga aurantiaca]